MSVTKSNATRKELKFFVDELGMKWREIAEMPKYKGIPLPTLSMIYLGKRDVPKKYRKQLNEPEKELADVCPIHGIVHDYDCQKQVVKAKREKKEPKQKKRYPRYYAWMFEQTKGW